MVIKRVELRFVELVVLLDLSIKPFQCFEVIPLVGIVQCLAEVQILQLVASTWTRCQPCEQQEPDH